MKVQHYTEAHREAELESAQAGQALVDYVIETAPAIYTRFVKAQKELDRLAKLADRALEDTRGNA